MNVSQVGTHSKLDWLICVIPSLVARCQLWFPFCIWGSRAEI